jgi:hypothetical protein
VGNVAHNLWIDEDAAEALEIIRPGRTQDDSLAD